MKTLILDLTEVEPAGWMLNAKVRILPIEPGKYTRQLDVIESQIPGDDLRVIKADASERLARNGLQEIEGSPVGFDISALPIGAKIIVMDNRL